MPADISTDNRPIKLRTRPMETGELKIKYLAKVQEWNLVGKKGAARAIDDALKERR